MGNGKTIEVECPVCGQDIAVWLEYTDDGLPADYMGVSASWWAAMGFDDTVARCPCVLTPEQQARVYAEAERIAATDIYEPGW